MTLATSFRSFPTEGHVKEFCRPGQGEVTCRYLTMSANGWSCEKASSLRRVLDEKVAKGQMGARGDNCGGLLQLILDNQEQLKGNTVAYEESMPTYHADGVFREAKIENEMLHIVVMWANGFDEGKETSVSLSEKNLVITVTPNNITFGIAGLTSFAGRTTIAFN